ncbi:hypothetical protein J2Z83_002233 [Virgibacillus natechei]|uniref:Uncharacterized protein n=1 Tax=Virgibacillus natechei TaxID=1216297 RepID=A0ABS4IGP6_9BACI|nr:hypothetical protein [Virgibacillus natechei]MBP1970117.1 hypothetical protein [Virgibacillus natechei]UZD14194.1 hypothetical protein OLD84_06665 [Virgibacillus natechei]
MRLWKKSRIQGSGIIANKCFFYSALALYLVTMILNFPFPHEEPFGGTVFSVLNIPLQTTNGLHYLGIITLILFIASLFFLAKSLKKYHIRILILAFILSGFLPSIMIDAYQSTFATGVYAVTYEGDSSNCAFDRADSETLHGICELSFENHSNEGVQFSLEFYDKYQFEDVFLHNIYE